MVGKESIIFKDNQVFFPSLQKAGMGDLINIKTSLSYQLSATSDFLVMVLDGDKIEWRSLSNIRVGDYVLLKRGYKLNGGNELIKWFKGKMHDRLSVVTNPTSEVRITSTGEELRIIHNLLLSYGVCSFICGQVDRFSNNKYRDKYLSITGEDILILLDSNVLSNKDKETVAKIVVNRKKRSHVIYPPMNDRLKLFFIDLYLSNKIQIDEVKKYREIEDYFKDKNLTRVEDFINEFNGHVNNNYHAEKLRQIVRMVKEYIYVKVKEVNFFPNQDLYNVDGKYINCFKAYDNGDKKFSILDLKK